MRMSYPLRPQIKAILLAVEELDEANAQEIDNWSTDVRIKSIHEILKRLDNGGWICSKVRKIEGERNRPRRYYKLSMLGKEAMRFHRACERLKAPDNNSVDQIEGRPN